jgi:transposase, IS5 family
MKQRTLAMMSGFERYKKKTKRALLLEEMEQAVPWRELCALIEPYYPKTGNGRPPVGVERMLPQPCYPLPYKQCLFRVSLAVRIVRP